MRPSDQLQQSYATLRGRKWSDKNCRGVGDNYGRHAITNFTDDARSVHSLADEFLLPVGRHHHSKSISRSTDKSLDSLGLDEESELIGGFAGLSNISTMLKREPPDGKEKPEPPKQKFETLSRKNSKCDLLERVQGDLENKEKRDSGAGLKDGYLDPSCPKDEDIQDRLKDW